MFEGAVFPLLIKSVKDRKDNSVDTLDIDESHHGPGSAPHFHKATFDHSGT
jgi:hypothetical protein